MYTNVQRFGICKIVLCFKKSLMFKRLLLIMLRTVVQYFYGNLKTLETFFQDFFMNKKCKRTAFI